MPLIRSTCCLCVYVCLPIFFFFVRSIEWALVSNKYHMKRSIEHWFEIGCDFSFILSCFLWEAHFKRTNSKALCSHFLKETKTKTTGKMESTIVHNKEAHSKRQTATVDWMVHLRNSVQLYGAPRTNDSLKWMFPMERATFGTVDVSNIPNSLSFIRLIARHSIVCEMQASVSQLPIHYSWRWCVRALHPIGIHIFIIHFSCLIFSIISIIQLWFFIFIALEISATM